MNKLSIRKDDTVIVLSGKDKGKQGKVLEVMPKEGPPSTPARCSASAPSATSPPGPLTSCWPTARRSASARSAAPRSERGGV